MILDTDAQSKLDEIIEDYGIVSEAPVPQFNGLPVDGLTEHQDGLICTADDCHYACRAPTQMDKHYIFETSTQGLQSGESHWAASV